jgi:hypothetical protein
MERSAAGDAEQVLRQNVEPASAWRVAIELARRDTEDCSLAFQNFEPIGGNKNGARGLVHSVIGAPDTL